MKKIIIFTILLSTCHLHAMDTSKILSQSDIIFTRAWARPILQNILSIHDRIVHEKHIPIVHWLSQKIKQNESVDFTKEFSKLEVFFALPKLIRTQFLANLPIILPSTEQLFQQDYGELIEECTEVTCANNVHIMLHNKLASQLHVIMQSSFEKTSLSSLHVLLPLTHAIANCTQKNKLDNSTKIRLRVFPEKSLHELSTLSHPDNLNIPLLHTYFTTSAILRPQ